MLNYLSNAPLALSLYEQSLGAARHAGHQGLMDVALTRLGMTALGAHDLERAQKYLEEAAEVEESWGNMNWRARTLHELGNIAYLQGNRRKARALYEKALALNRQLNNENGVGYNQGQLARLALDANKVVVAEPFLYSAFEIGQRTNDAGLMLTALKVLIELCEAHGYTNARNEYIKRGAEQLPAVFGEGKIN